MMCAEKAPEMEVEEKEETKDWGGLRAAITLLVVRRG